MYDVWISLVYCRGFVEEAPADAYMMMIRYIQEIFYCLCASYCYLRQMIVSPLLYFLNLVAFSCLLVLAF